ncbi:MAG TPA: SpoIIE family protein phosphatase [Candidatus Eisenbacteria bacterium]|nr:SpoIIE family protein phosphatase [Candidatus Eisenbacteria bacterium]
MIPRLGGRVQPTRRFHLRVAGEERHLAEIRDFVQEAGEKLLIPNKVLANTKLAVDEACTNVVKHGYKGSAGEIDITIVGNGREFSIELRDTGKSFDLRNVKSPDLKMYVETRRKGGLGVFLMNQLMDEVRYSGGTDGNTLTMSKRLGKGVRRRKKGTVTKRSLRFTYTVRAFGAITFLVGVGFGLIHMQQVRSVNQETVAQARSGARTLMAPALAALARPEPMSIDQTLLNQAVVAMRNAHREYQSLRVLDVNGRVWGSDRFEELFTRRSLPDPAARTGEALADGRVRTLFEPIVPPGPAAATARPRPVGWIEIDLREAAIAERIGRARTDLAVIALFTLVLGFAASTLLIQIFVKPIQTLSDTVRMIGEGTMVADIGSSGNEEIDDIARAFNEVTAQFRAAQGHLMEQDRLQREMQVAQEIQQTLLPRKVPELEGFEIGYLYRAAKEVGGDYFDFLHVDDRTEGVVVADVSGKGVPGSLVMTMIRTALRMEARGNRSASDVMAKMNAFVTEDMKKGMFVTMFYVVLDSLNRTVSYASAGHNPMILYRAQSDTTYFLKPKGIPVGINTPDQDLFRKTISVEKLRLRRDDMLVIYTDGITEAMNLERDQFGEGRLLAAIKRYGHLTPQEFSDRLNTEIQEFTGGAPQNDDITLVAVKERVEIESRMAEKRLELVRLVEEEGVPIGEACARLRMTPSSYARLKRLRDAIAQGAEPVPEKKPRFARASLEEEAAILELVRGEPLSGAKKILDALRAANRCRDELSERGIYDVLRRHGLNTKEKRLQMAQGGTDNRMARLAEALHGASPARPTDSEGGGA